MLASSRTRYVFLIHEDMSEEATGARIKIDRDGKEAIITGTYGQCETAQSRMKHYLEEESVKPRPSVYPDVGYTIVDSQSPSKNSRIRFIQYMERDSNSHSHGRNLYYIHLSNESPHSDFMKDWDILTPEVESPHQVMKNLEEFMPSPFIDMGDHGLWLDDYGSYSANRSRSSSNSSKSFSTVGRETCEDDNDITALLPVPTRQRPFTVTSLLPYCLKQISDRVSEMFPIREAGLEIHTTIYLGQELFFNIPLEPSSLDIKEWCGLKRIGHKAVKTSFQHHAPSIDGRRILEANMGFKEASPTHQNERCSIDVYFNDGEEKKMKLIYDQISHEWTIKKVVKNLRRIVLVDLLSGSEAPDIRFTLKTQTRIPIDPDLKRLVKDVQDPNRNESFMALRPTDFAGTWIHVTRVEQAISKTNNANYRISVVPTKQDADAERVTYGNNITLKHVDWIRMSSRLSSLPIKDQYQQQSYQNEYDLISFEDIPKQTTSVSRIQKQNIEDDVFGIEFLSNHINEGYKREENISSEFKGILQCTIPASLDFSRQFIQRIGA
ncbi:24143_t:CDS:2 [Dentiscutata erythropus]|uniref:24143_t:CDS:1 n=1 Tax=Dentiscutata erythropus TaxID=1348616 RepID=A0A9N9G4F9_9GLOM|nr:24143_t:CDS:2 [Dentiscutata erythropus]